MVKVTIRTLRAGLTGASGLMLLQQGAAGCAAPTGEAGVDSSSSSITTVDPGTGTINLSPNWTPQGTTHYSFDVRGSTDEYVRVGERLNVDVSAYQLWTTLKPGIELPDVEVLKTLQASFQVTFVARGEVVGRANAAVSSWSGGDPWSLMGSSDGFTVPAKTDTIEMGMTIVDPSDAAKIELADLDFDTLYVFGGDPTLKHVLFDNDGSTLRQRVLEGGGLVAGGTLDLSYSDWRADELVDKMNLDRQIGTIQTYGRFGPVTYPIYGQIQYEITAGFSYDANGWSQFSLPASPSSHVLPYAGRTAYESTLWVQPGTTELNLYFHVKAFLVADYTSYASQGGTVNRKYTQGDRIFLREAWDNKDGQAFANYEVPVEAAP